MLQVKTASATAVKRAKSMKEKRKEKESKVAWLCSVHVAGRGGCSHVACPQLVFSLEGKHADAVVLPENECVAVQLLRRVLAPSARGAACSGVECTLQPGGRGVQRGCLRGSAQGPACCTWRVFGPDNVRLSRLPALQLARATRSFKCSSMC